MKRLFYLLFGLVLLPALLYAQGTLSLKDINDNLTNNYYNKIASDARYATTTYGYSSAEVDLLLAPKADKTYVNATDEAIISDNDSQDVQIEANRVAITLKATQIDMDSAEAAINANNIGDDSQDVTIEANRVGVASLEVGLQTHQNNPTGAHAATAISATWTNVQVSLDSIEATIQGIVVGSGFATEAWVNSTLETNFYTQAQTNATIEAAIAAIPAPSVNQTVTVPAAENLTEGNVVSLINDGGTWKAKRTDNTNVAGVAMSTVTTGNNVVVTLKGTVANQSGLTTGALYYRKADYTISVTPELINGAYIFVGYAKSATELVLD